MAEKVAIGPNGERIIFRSAINDVGETKWIQVPDLVGGSQSAYQNMAENLAQKADNILADYRLPQVKSQDTEAQNLSGLDKAMIEAGKVATGFGSGLKSAGLKAGGMIADAWGREYPWLVDPQTGTDMYSAAVNEDKRREDEQQLMQGFERNKGISGVIGGMLPYMLSSYGAGPISKNIANKALSTVEDVATAAATEGKSLLGRSSRAMANSSMPGVRQFGKRAVDEWVKPLEARSAILKQRPEIISPYRKGVLSDIIGGTALGAVEGAVNQDMTSLEGAISSLLGSTTGRSLKYTLGPAPLPSKPAYNELMQRRNNWGHRNTPGEILDNPQLQTFEHGLRNADRTSQIMKYFDDANKQADNKVAYATMGFDGSTITKDKLNAHVKILGDEYNALADKTTARLDNSAMANLNRHTMSLTGQASDEGIKAAKLANDWFNKFKIFRKNQQNFIRNSRGRIDYQASGQKWQELRSELKDDITSAYNRNEPKVANALKPFLTELNNAADKGITRLGRTSEEGAQILRQWKDLDERYAMSKILKEHGLDDVTLDVNPQKLHNYFRTNGPERYITGNYGKTSRINSLFDIAESRPIEQEMAGSTLSGLNVKDKGSRTKLPLYRKLLGLPVDIKPSIMDEMYTKLYLSDFSPQVKGMSLGLINNKGFRDTGLLSRSAAQSLQTVPTIYDTVTHPVKTIQDMISDVVSRM